MKTLIRFIDPLSFRSNELSDVVSELDKLKAQPPAPEVLERARRLDGAEVSERYIQVLRGRGATVHYVVTYFNHEGGFPEHLMPLGSAKYTRQQVREM
ncbi:MAG: hypothetical protein AB1668_01685 [Nanoarchaeota archaeon]